MNKYEIEYTDQAIHDIEIIYEYIAYVQKEQINALNLINEIKKSVLLLSTFPFMYKIYEYKNENNKYLRYLVVKNHYIIYLIDEINSKIYILRIFSCKKNDVIL